MKYNDLQLFFTFNTFLTQNPLISKIFLKILKWNTINNILKVFQGNNLKVFPTHRESMWEGLKSEQATEQDTEIL